MTAINAGYIILGLVLLAFGGDRIVSGGVRAARALQVPTVVIGVVMLGFGTSLPELFTSLGSVFAGAPDIAVGNVVGSNVANLLLIVGVAAALGDVRSSRRLVSRDGAVMLAATLVFAWLLYVGGLSPVAGVALLAGLAGFIGLALAGWTAGGSSDAEAMVEDVEEAEDDAARRGRGLFSALVIFALGVALTVGGAAALVEGAVGLAREAQISEAVIGATIVAVGTSLPELAATVAAALKGRSDMAIGNVFGSNIFNILGIAGAASLFGPLATPATILTLDLWAMLGATALALVMTHSWSRVSRPEGVLLLLLYALYLGLSAENASL